MTMSESLSNVETGDVIVTGGPIGTGTMRLAFIGQHEGTDITLSVSDAGLTTTEVLAGGSVITESSRAAVWGVPGASASCPRASTIVVALIGEAEFSRYSRVVIPFGLCGLGLGVAHVAAVGFRIDQND